MLQFTVRSGFSTFHKQYREKQEIFANLCVMNVQNNEKLT